MQKRPVWAKISLENIVHNYREVRRLVGPDVQVMAVVKANAYGHGATEVSKALDAAGAERFAVAIMNEAVGLRKDGITKPILVMGWTPAEDYERALQNEITLTIFSLQEAEELSRISTALNKKALVHIKVNTGMTRLGFCTDRTGLEDAAQIIRLPGLEVEGIFTHLAKADESDKTYTKKQLALFRDFVSGVEEKTGFRFRIKHAANSAAVIDHPEAYFDMVRPGIMLYGLKPSGEVRLERVDLRQAMTLQARISYVREVTAGVCVSYGGRFVTPADAVIATLPLGYADGYSRLLTGKAQVICGGIRVPVVGRICMDQLMIDVTRVNPRVRQGDIVTLIGSDRDNFISVDELAANLGTINYEVTCMISARVPRVYREQKDNTAL